jgi:hypothetical protein
MTQLRPGETCPSDVLQGGIQAQLTKDYAIASQFHAILLIFNSNSLCIFHGILF